MFTDEDIELLVLLEPRLQSPRSSLHPRFFDAEHDKGGDGKTRTPEQRRKYNERARARRQRRKQQ